VVANKPYDAAVLDLLLGANDGISLPHKLHGHTADPLVVVVSGTDARVRAASCRMADAPGVRVAGALEKPIVPARLRARLGRMPNHSAAPQTYQARLPTAAELKAALDQQAISVEFQPQVRLNDGRVLGLEALARWRPVGTQDPIHLRCLYLNRNVMG
jgi:DNA-binding response OmpR family regulator